MEHGEALNRGLCDRYLLGQLSEAEERDFERHYLRCPACVEGVRARAAFVAALRTALREPPRRRPWLGRLILWWWRLEDRWRGQR